MENNLKIEEKKENVDGTVKSNQFKKGQTSWNRREDVRGKFEEIIILYTQENKTCNDISNIFRCSKNTIYRILRENNKIKEHSEIVENISKKLMGVTKSEITKENMSKVRKGKHYSPETEFKKGHKNYNPQFKGCFKKGQISLTKRNDLREKILEISELYLNNNILMSTEEIGKMFGCDGTTIRKILKENDTLMTNSERYKLLFKMGKIKDWCEGLTKETDIRVKRISDKLSGRNRPDISLIKKGKHMSPNTEFTKESRKNLVLPVKDSSIEVKVQNFLKQLGIEFFTHQYMKIEHAYQCDILIPSINLVLEIDGDYWHANPIFYPNPTGRQQEQISRDRIRTTELIAKGFKVLRLWECDINHMSIDNFKEKLNLLRIKNG